MDAIDLQKLSDFDFEILCKDLFSRILGVSLEIFTPGPDGGVDLRHLSPTGDSLVVQCKHWMRSGRAKFVAHMLDSEMPKIKRMRPARYVIATTVGMTPQAKEKLYEAFSPYLQSRQDIYGVDEIASALGDNPDIIRKHLRLWLNDSTILESVVTRNIIWRSTHLAEELKQTLRTYVPSRNLRQAMSAIEKNHVCVLTGPPGVGKTTLAQVLCAYYAAKSFELIEVSENVEDAFRVWSEDSQQIFIYDDFLGQSSLEEKLHKNEDARLLSLIGRVRRDPRKRFICTTRGYIWKQALQRYERLDRANLDPILFQVDLEGFTREEKAQILHNHVFWSEWPQIAKEEFSYPESYRPILRHRDFNPRAISNALAVPFDPENGKPVDQVLASLGDPLSLWRHIFDNQLSAEDQLLLAVLFSLGSKSSKEVLKRAFVELGKREAQFLRSLRILEGTFVKVTVENGGSWIEFSNPSVNDFMLIKLAREGDWVRDILTRPYSFDQVSNLWSAHTGPCDVEVPAKIDLSAYVSILEQAALCTLSRDTSVELDLVGRLATCLYIADEVNVPHLEQRIVTELSIQGKVYGARDLDDIAQLIRLSGGSKSAKIRSMHAAIKLEGLTALFNRDRRDCGLFRAAMYALLLADYVDERIRQGICAEADALVDATLEAYILGPEEPDDDTMLYALQYMQRYENWAEIWPMSAGPMLDYGLIPTDDDFEEEDGDEVAQIDPEGVDGEVYQIMSSLRITEEAESASSV
ncbi:ATP-binding protein [Streptomyces sp. NPDC006540]|uniref:ATP-binding protein n=1 Tax=Streptomyces sp. NPDC006540 TaxID=3155353 RepID=UPI0033B6A778